ncbi:MAG: prenyltransferase/squalene oxidase repeat-containing protein [Planctomycetota bacterium]|nr:prenyltransferase/squalene oxidase repeat-containing protein [Planctomycetota bacterium]
MTKNATTSLVSLIICLTFAAPVRGQEELVAGQSPDGAWESDNGKTCETTALAVLALHGAGYTPIHFSGSSESAPSLALRRGLFFLRACRHTEGELAGYFFNDCVFPVDSSENPMLGHMITTFAVASVFSWLGTPALKQPLEEGLKFILARQLTGGGWPGRLDSQEPDLETSCWAVFALRETEAGDKSANAESARKGLAYIHSAVKSGLAQGGGERGTTATDASPSGKEQPTAAVLLDPALLAFGLLALECSGAEDAQALLDTFRPQLEAGLPSASRDNPRWWFFATALVWRCSGLEGKTSCSLGQDSEEFRKRWGSALRDAIWGVKKVESSSPLPATFDSRVNPGAMYCLVRGKAYWHAMSALALQRYYRYEPLFRGTAR